MMTFDEFKKAAFEAALTAGCTAAEVLLTDEEEFSVKVQKGEIDDYSSAHSFGLNLRVQVNGKNGYAYTELLEDPEELVKKAMDNAAAIESSDDHPMQPACEYTAVEAPVYKAMDMTAEEKIAYAKELENKLLAADPRVLRSEETEIGTAVVKKRLHNTLGLAADSEQKLCYSVIVPIMQQGDEIKNSVAFRSGDKLFDIEDLVREGVSLAAEQFCASPVPTGEYDIVLRNNAAAEMLRAFSGMFSADACQKGLSLLAGREGQSIASEAVTVVDDPFYPENPRAFDAEGVPSVTKKVVDKGVLTTLLHNLKTAKKAGVASTSNAGRTSSGPVGVSPSNFYIAKGKPSFDELVSQMNSGLIITEVSGLHSGLNAVSGDFSLIAKGILVENGKAVRSVDQITVAGNFLKLMHNIAAVGCDLRFGIPMGANVGSPSLLIKGIMVSGA